MYSFLLLEIELFQVALASCDQMLGQFTTPGRTQVDSLSRKFQPASSYMAHF